MSLFPNRENPLTRFLVKYNMNRKTVVELDSLCDFFIVNCINDVKLISS